MGLHGCSVIWRSRTKPICGGARTGGNHGSPRHRAQGAGSRGIVLLPAGPVCRNYRPQMLVMQSLWRPPRAAPTHERLVVQAAVLANLKLAAARVSVRHCEGLQLGDANI